MKKEWFIIIDKNKEGPYSLFDLKRDYRITPDTLVWKVGFPKWLKMREVKELKELFEDQDDSDHSDEEDLNLSKIKRDDSVIALTVDPFMFWFWLFVGILLILYVFHKLGWFDL